MEGSDSEPLSLDNNKAEEEETFDIDVLLRSTMKNSISISVTNCKKLKDSETNALIDSGAQGLFVDESIVELKDARRLARPIKVRNVDGTQNRGGSITHEILLSYEIGSQNFTEWFNITDLGDQTMILGIPWLQKHNPMIDWKQKTITLQEEPKRWETKDTTEIIVRTIGDSPSTSQSARLEEATQYIQDIGWIEPELVWIRKLTASQSMAHEAQKKEKDKIKITLPTEFEKYRKVFDEATST